MDNRGFVALIALWLSAVAGAIGILAVSATRRDNRRSAAEANDTHARYAVLAAAIVAHAGNFPTQRVERTVDRCLIRAESQPADNGKTVVLFCETLSGDLRRRYDIGWRRVGAEWVPAWWRER